MDDIFLIRFLFLKFPWEDTAEGCLSVRYEVMEVPITLPFQKPPADKPNPKQGIGKLFLLANLVHQKSISIEGI